MWSPPPTGWVDYCYWTTTDPDLVKRIHELIKDIGRDPFKGIGKPEALRHELAGCWSRRIDRKNWKVTVLMCCYHYDR